MYDRRHSIFGGFGFSLLERPKSCRLNPALTSIFWKAKRMTSKLRRACPKKREEKTVPTDRSQERQSGNGNG